MGGSVYPDINFDEGISISPLATPILDGTGTIVTHGFYQRRSHAGIIVLIFGLMSLLMYLSFRSGELIQHTIGENKIAVIGKLMGLIIVIVDTNMMVEGINPSFNLKESHSL